jgi:hypothetical protein
MLLCFYETNWCDTLEVHCFKNVKSHFTSPLDLGHYLLPNVWDEDTPYQPDITQKKQECWEFRKLHNKVKEETNINDFSEGTLQMILA